MLPDKTTLYPIKKVAIFILVITLVNVHQFFDLL